MLNRLLSLEFVVAAGSGWNHEAITGGDHTVATGWSIWWCGELGGVPTACHVEVESIGEFRWDVADDEVVSAFVPVDE
jgi:hypothetical protein